MSTMKSRLQALEDRQRRQHRPGSEHFSPVVHVPPTIPHDAWLEWLDVQPCACGRTGCDQRRVGALLPEKCESPEAWESRYGREVTP